MTQLWLRWPLCLLSCTAPIQGEDVTLRELESVTTVQFWRGSNYLDQEGVARLCAWIESHGKESPWIIAVPEKSAVSEAAIQATREALQRCGVTRIRRMIVQSEGSGPFDWLHIGKARSLSGPQEAPLENPAHATPVPPAKTPAQPSSSQPETPSKPAPKSLTPNLDLSFDAGFEYQSIHLQAPDQTRLLQEGHLLLSLSAQARFRWVELGVTYALDKNRLSEKTLQTFEPVSGVSDGEIHHLEKQSVFIAFPQFRIPFQVAYEKTLLCTGASLDAALLLITPSGQATSLSGHQFKMPLKNEKTALLIDLTHPLGQSLRTCFGIHYIQYQTPFQIQETTTQTHFLTQADLKAYGIHARRKGIQTPSGLDITSFELHLSQLKGDSPINTYLPSIQALSNKSTFQIAFYYTPTFTQKLGKRMHARITLPLSYQHLFSKETSTTDASGNTYRGKRCLPDFSYGLNCQLGYRF